MQRSLSALDRIKALTDQSFSACPPASYLNRHIGQKEWHGDSMYPKLRAQATLPQPCPPRFLGPSIRLNSLVSFRSSAVMALISYTNSRGGRGMLPASDVHVMHYFVRTRPYSCLSMHKTTYRTAITLAMRTAYCFHSMN
eukprot:6206975-Pleurochrysis_carterae.AAC.1